MNAYKYFGGVTRIIQCDNLKTGVQKHGKDEVVLNKSYEKDLIAVAERLNKIMEDVYKRQIQLCELHRENSFPH